MFAKKNDDLTSRVISSDGFILSELVVGRKMPNKRIARLVEQI